MKAVIIFLGLSLFACSNKKIQETNRNPSEPTYYNESGTGISFKNYIKTLDQIPLPFNYSQSGKLPELSRNYNREGFEKYKHVWTSQPLGILFKENNFVALVDCSIGDTGLVPCILTFDNHGNKIDSLAPYGKSGSDIGYESTEFIRITKEKDIIVIDSTKKWTLKDDKSDLIEGTMKLTVDTTIYKVDNQGRFKKN